MADRESELFPGPRAIVSTPGLAIQAVGCAAARTPQGCSRKAQGASPGMSGMRTGSALKGRSRSDAIRTIRRHESWWRNVVANFIGRLLRPFRAGVLGAPFPRACALGFPAPPLRGSPLSVSQNLGWRGVVRLAPRRALISGQIPETMFVRGPRPAVVNEIALQFAHAHGADRIQARLGERRTFCDVGDAFVAEPDGPAIPALCLHQPAEAIEQLFDPCLVISPVNVADRKVGIGALAHVKRPIGSHMAPGARYALAAGYCQG